MKISEFLEKYGDKEVDEKKLKEELGIKTVWKPVQDEKFYYIEDSGQIYHAYYGDEFMSEIQMEIGNCFKTREEAEFMVEKLKVIKELKDFAFENNGKIDWDNEQLKWRISYDTEYKEIMEYAYTKLEKGNDIYFTSKEIKDKAIEKVGADRIKKYYLEVEE